jgi:hypothetical protein
MYIFKLLLNVVTAELRHLTYRGISFCMPVSKKSATFELSHILTPSINSSLLKQDQSCKQGGQTTPSSSAPAVLEYEQLYVDEH